MTDPCATGNVPDREVALDDALILPAALQRWVLRAARQLAPQEACGFLIGHWAPAGQRVSCAVASPNTADTPHTAFLLDPALHLRLERQLRPTGRHILGIYHSHPNGPAEPSERDRAGAEVTPGWVWLIAAPGTATLTAWRAGQGGLSPIPLSSKAIDHVVSA